MTDLPVVLSLRGLAKRYGAVHALRGVDLELRAGEVHALLGENGAGKSTLLRILAGATQADAGEVTLDGAAYAPRGPRAARDAGVTMIHQELALAPDLSIEQNVVLGLEPCLGARRRRTLGLGVIDRGARRARTQLALVRLGRADLDPRAPVATLSPGDRQMVEIARAVAGAALPRVLIFDEPTSSLAGEDVERLFAVIRALADAGVAVVYVSHFLEEVRRVADVFTVLRDGASVGAGRLAEHTEAELVTLMAGRAVAELFPTVARAAGAALLDLSALTGARGLPDAATLQLARGEVLGLAGLVGAGRTELLRALYGLDPVVSGEVTVAALERPKGGRVAAAHATPRARIRQGFGLLSEDRKGEGLALELSLAVNATLSNLGAVGRGGWISRKAQRAAAERWFERLRVRRDSPWQPARSLSGGNQQKVALARLLHQDADILLLDEPTRGVDVGARAEIYRLIGELAAAGRAVLMVSSYLPELLGVADRIAVMHRGRLGPARPASEWTEHALLMEATGALEGAR